jgi:ankyrin repeat protein
MFMSERYTRLYQLAKNGRVEELLVILNSLERDDGDGDAKNWALIAAAEENQLATVSALLDAGASPNGSVSQRQHIKPLWKSAKRGHIAMVKLLISRGADLQGTDGQGMGALEYAIRYRKQEVATYLAPLAKQSSNDR